MNMQKVKDNIGEYVDKKTVGSFVVGAFVLGAIVMVMKKSKVGLLSKAASVAKS